jgi:hypothetical protein
MTNTLFIVTAPLGDMICFSSFLKDYKETYPNENLYIRIQLQPLTELFQYNEYVKLYDENIQYDKIYDYNLYYIDQTELSKQYSKLIRLNQGSLQHKHYIYMNELYNLNIKHKTFYPIVQFDTNKLEKIESDKPICIINPSPGYLGFDSRFWGIKNYQYVIDALKDKINFISIGSNNYNGFIRPMKLNNLFLDLVNKTNISQMLNLIYQADFVLTHESGLYHSACIPTNKHKHVIVPGGMRHTFESDKWISPNTDIHWLAPETTEIYYKHCFNEHEHMCARGCIFSELHFSSVHHSENGANCKLPVFDNGEVLSHCLYKIKPENVVKLIENILENKNDKNN